MVNPARDDASLVTTYNKNSLNDATTTKVTIQSKNTLLVVDITIIFSCLLSSMFGNVTSREYQNLATALRRCFVVDSP
jgi:hypothetical protein